MTIQPTETFREILHGRNIKLFHKWYNNRYMGCYGVHKKEYTNSERDELAICARLARRYTNQGE